MAWGRDGVARQGVQGHGQAALRDREAAGGVPDDGHGKQVGFDGPKPQPGERLLDEIGRLRVARGAGAAVAEGGEGRDQLIEIGGGRPVGSAGQDRGQQDQESPARARRLKPIRRM